MIFILFGIIVGVILNQLVHIDFSTDIIKNINNNYANVIGFMVSFMTAIITTIYVIFTYKQVKVAEQSIALAEQSATYSQLAVTANQEMVESMNQQIKQANNPCIVPEITKSHGTSCFYKTRRQLHINFEIKNIGDSPAISIYAFAWFKLKHTLCDGKDNVAMYFLPDYIPNLEVNKKNKFSVRFETDEIKALINDLSRAYSLNTERINTDPSKAAYPDTDLVLRIYYKNIAGQWYEVTYIREILSIEVKGKSFEDKKSNKTKIKAFEKSVPPQSLDNRDVFELEFISEMFSLLDIKLVDEDKIEKLLSPFKDELNNPVNKEEVINL